MKIGEFITLCETTKDTVRHYENLGLLNPSKRGSLKEFGEKETMAFHAIREMQQLGLSLKEITTVFEQKKIKGCGSAGLLENIQNKLTSHLEKVKEEEKKLLERRIQLETIIEECRKIREEQP